MLLQVMQSCKANTQNTCNGEKIKFFWNKIHLPFLFTYTRNFTLVNKINVMKKLLLPFLFILLFTSCKTNPPTPPVPVIATLTTTAASAITATTATSGGNITSDGGAAITARGVCWNTSTGPTIVNSKT